MITSMKWKELKVSFHLMKGLPKINATAAADHIKNASPWGRGPIIGNPSSVGEGAVVALFLTSRSEQTTEVVII